MNNIFDLDAPFVATALENGYDESAFDIKGWYWYVAFKRRFLRNFFDYVPERSSPGDRLGRLGPVAGAVGGSWPEEFPDKV
jgi:hypothetical protein